MSFTQFFMRSFTALALVATSLLAPAVQAQSGAPHAVVTPPQPSDSPGKVEVLEFFAYSCPHCATMEPLVESWSKSLPEDVVLKRVPVAFNASMADMQKLYYTLESMDRMDLHPKVFEAIHKQRKRLFTADAITDWVTDQGVDQAQFESVFNSFGIKAKVSRADELTNSYNIEGTPSLAVAGKYVVSPSMTGSYQGTIDEAKKLVEQERKAAQ